MGDVRIFMIFDPLHDEDLHDRLLEQSSRGNSGFKIAARSARGNQAPGDERVRLRIREVDEVIVICGVHTAASPVVSAELRIAQEERKPYFLLWGRREAMCTKPVGAKPADSMYSWTAQILHEQIGLTLRAAKFPRQNDRKSATLQEKGSVA
jgi:hypothetical protein